MRETRFVDTCDLCGIDVSTYRHYRFTRAEFSTINGDYLLTKELLICFNHEGERIPYDKLFEKAVVA